MWPVCEHVLLSEADLGTLVSRAVAGFDDASGLRASGIKLAGEKYMYLRNDEEMMCGKKGQGGVCIFKTGQAIMIGTYNQDMSPANNTKEVGKMADYLKEVGY